MLTNILNANLSSLNILIYFLIFIVVTFAVIIVKLYKSVKNKNELLRKQKRVLTLPIKEKLLYNLSESLRNSLSLDDALSTLCKELLLIFKTDEVIIASYAGNLSEYRWDLLAEYNNAGLEVKTTDKNTFSLQSQEFLAKNLLEENKNIVIENIDESNLFAPLKVELVKLGAKSFLGLPFMKDDDKWGVLLLLNFNDYKKWTDKEIELIKYLVNQIFMTIKQVELNSIMLKQAERETILRELITTITSSLDIDSIKKIIVSKIVTALGSDMNIFYLVKPDTKKFVPVDESSFSLSSFATKSPLGLDLESYDFGDFFRNKANETIYLNTEEFRDKYNMRGTKGDEFLNYYEIKSFIIIPVTYANEFYGLLAINYIKEAKRVNNNDIELAKTFAQQAAVAIHESNLLIKEKQTTQREKLLRNVISSIRSSLDIYEIKKVFVNEVGQLLGSDRSFISVFNTQGNIFEPIDKDSEYLSSPDVKSNIGEDLEIYKFYTSELRKKNEIIVQNAEDFLNQYNLREMPFIDYLIENNVKSGVGLPILYGDEILGIFAVQFTKALHLFTEEELEFLRTLANQAGIAIYQAMLYKAKQDTAFKERILKELVNELKGIETIKELFEQTLKKIAIVFGVSRAILIEVPKYKNVRPRIRYEYKETEQMGTMIDYYLPDECIITYSSLIKTFKPVVINNTMLFHPEQIFRQEFYHAFNVGAFLSLPIINEDEVIGGIVTISEIPRVWKTEDIELIRAIIEVLVTAMNETIKRNELEELRNTFILTLAHDLQVPLVGEHKAFEYILSRPHDENIGKFKDLLVETQKNNENIYLILERFINTYQYDLGTRQLNFVYSDIVTIIDKAVKALDDMAISKLIVIDLEVQENLPYVNIDIDEIYKVIFNILENALSFSPSQGKVLIKCYQHSDELIVVIKDKGPGLDEDIQSKMFERYKMAKIVQRKIGGGLGLYLSKQILEAHGGRIWYETKKDQGTTFYFSLPIKIPD